MSIEELHVGGDDLATFRESGAPDPEVVVVAGSGLGGLGTLVEDRVEIGFEDLPAFPKVASMVPGHAGRLFGGRAGELPVALFLGRLHVYQGVSAFDAAYPARFAATLEAHTLIVTNASGSVSNSIVPGDVVLITDHINLTGENPLEGWSGPAGGTPFVPMTGAYDPGLILTAREAAREAGVSVREGVYAGVRGPTYETPAEAGYIRELGAQVVGMSTVPEVIVARAAGIRVLGLSVVTNKAGADGLSHDEVLEAGKRAEEALTNLVAGILRRL